MDELHGGRGPELMQVIRYGLPVFFFFLGACTLDHTVCPLIIISVFMLNNDNALITTTTKITTTLQIVFYS